MKIPRLFVSASTLTVLFASVACAQNGFAIKDGDRVVFYGDSITDARQYNTMTETYILTRFPKLKVNFFNSGWGGDRVTGGGGGGIDQRLQRDVLVYKPTVMTIMLGMNDGGYRAFDQSLFDTYSTGYQHILDTVKQAYPGVRITTILPSPYDDVTRPPSFDGGYNAVLTRYGQFVKGEADKEKLGVADFNTPVVAMLQKANAADPALAPKLIPDRVHPGAGGHLVMAEALLKSWNAPSLVTAVEIDAVAKKVVRSENTVVTDFKAGAPLSWTQLDAALPFPISMNDPSVALAIKSSDFIEQLDQQPLKVTGLAPGNYVLAIDGAEVGTFAATNMAAGVNLATLATPMMAQAIKVNILTLARAQIHNDRWRNIQVPLENNTFPAVKALVPTTLPPLLAALDAQETDALETQRAQAQSVSHSYTLTLKP